MPSACLSLVLRWPLGYKNMFMQWPPLLCVDHQRVVPYLKAGLGEYQFMKSSSCNQGQDTTEEGQATLSWQSLTHCGGILLATWDRKMHWTSGRQRDSPSSFKALVFRPVTSIRYSHWGQSLREQLDWGAQSPSLWQGQQSFESCIKERYMRYLHPSWILVKLIILYDYKNPIVSLGNTDMWNCIKTKILTADPIWSYHPEIIIIYSLILFLRIFISLSLILCPCIWDLNKIFTYIVMYFFLTIYCDYFLWKCLGMRTYYIMVIIYNPPLIFYV